MENKKLNTMDSFRVGFKIEREGKIFTLTNEEMSQFRFFDRAITGQDKLEVFKEWEDFDEKYKNLTEELSKDEFFCEQVESDCEDAVYKYSDGVELDVVKKCVESEAEKKGENE